MRQETTLFAIPTKGRGLHEFTRDAEAWVRASGVTTGLLSLHVRHTSASLLVQENADPTVKEDLERLFARLAPDGDPMFRHDGEGPDDMPAHARAALTATTLSIPVIAGRLALGTWQGLYLFEHRLAPHRRQVAAHLIGS